jgi:hypothetical protein
MKQNETIETIKTAKNAKNAYNFACAFCEYSSRNKSDYERHLITIKHQTNVNETLLKQKTAKKLKKTQDHTCLCGLSFKSRTTLWRHKTSCCNETETENETELNGENKKTEYNKDLNKLNTDKDFILMLIKQNSELLEIVKNGTNNTTTNTNCMNNNKTFNLQFFLNETCKNAMNIMDFVETIKVQLQDLEQFGDVGYVQGVTNIITTNLKDLDITQRPVHCTDQKRETIYIKDSNQWEKEDDNKSKLRKVIHKIANKNINLLPKFREKYPDYSNSSSKTSDKYDKMVIEAMGGYGDDLEKENKIIHNISKNIVIDK